MIVISISTERKLLSNNPTKERILNMGKSFEQYHIVVFSMRANSFQKQTIGNTTIYPTNSSNKLLYIFDAIMIVFRILKNIIKKNSDKIVLTVQDPFECGLVGLIVSRIKAIPMHVQVHTDLFSPFFKNTFLQYVRMIIAPFVIKRAKSIRTDSKRMKDGILKRNWSNAPIEVLPIFIDVEKYNKPAVLDVHSLFNEKRIVLLMASRLEAEKEMPMAIDVFYRINSIYSKKAGLVIVGSGSEERALKDQVKRLKIEQDVLFVSWTDDLVSYYKTADLFWMNSRFEGYGLTIAESLVSGTPVLTSDVGVAPEIVIEGKNGFICPPLDVECFYKKISSIIESDTAFYEIKDYMNKNPYFHKYAKRDVYEKTFVSNIAQSLE